MAVSTQLIRVKNPRRRRRNARRSPRMFRNKKGRFIKRSRGRAKAPRRSHKRSNPTVRYTKRRRSNTTKRHSRRRRNTRRTYSRKNKRRVYRRRRPNPVLIELGAVNPRKRRTHVARRNKHRRNPRRRHVRARRVYRRRRRRNPTMARGRGVPAWAKAYGYRRRNRRHNRKRRHYGYRRRRNPAIFGRSSGKDLMIMVGGGLVGVAATKYLPTLLPATITAGLGGGPLMSVLMTGAGAFVAGWLAGKIDKNFGEAVLFGGLMQTGSAALNAFAPPTIAGRLALSGVGDIVPTGPFTVPNNQFKTLAMPAPNGMAGFRTAFGRR